MILPTTFVAALTLTILAMLCWGLWPNLFKSTKSWRFELFYFDFAIGVMLAFVAAAFTFGSFGDELSFIDNFSITGKRQIGSALIGGALLNIGNMLMLAAISIIGMAVAFPLSVGLAFAIGAATSHLISKSGSVTLSLGSAAVVLVALVVTAMAYGAGVQSRVPKKSFKPKGLLLATAGGVLMGISHPLIGWSRLSEVGLGPYAIGVLLAAGVLISTLVFNLYFMNLPVQGKPIQLGAYLTGSSKQHALGVLGGCMWAVGILSFLVVSGAPPEAKLSTHLSFALTHGAILVAAISGLLIWKEFEGASGRAKGLLLLTLLLVTVGLVLFASTPSSAS